MSRQSLIISVLFRVLAALIAAPVALLALLAAPAAAQSAPGQAALMPPLEWRSIGPDRGGRSIAVAGHSDRPFEYYFGATGGGLFKTTDGGTSWSPVTDGQIRSGSVGAVTVAESNPDVVYIGMGEVQLRANVLQGDGVYRSDDGGRNWRHVGLENTQAIGRIRVHPTDPERAFVAALGHPFGPSADRGVFRTTDGGRTWDKVLFRNDRTGAVDLVMDPHDPDVLYATLWEVHRKPWQLWSGGEGSGIFKTTDGGDTWSELTDNPGFPARSVGSPAGVLGKIAITVSGADSQRIWANVEAEAGGLYMSDDGGSSWTLVNAHRDIWQRAFYFQRIQADPVDRNTIYILNFRLMKSTDAGRTLESVRETHADHHDIWIDPGNPLRMINGNDGGGVVSVNGGRTWTGMKYPTAQIYRLATTTDFPYHACGAQQDNSTVCVSSEEGHLQNPRGVSTEWMYSVGGGESGYVAPRPTDPSVFYAGATNALTRYDRNTGLVRDIQPHPRIVMGEPARDMPERWNWTYPIAVSLAEPAALYVGSQHLWKSTDEGESWLRISPDLTRAEPETMGDSGGPVVKDQDGPEIYATLYALAPSPHDQATIWTGSDDGLVHITRDSGESWSDVTPPDMPAHTRVMSIDVSPHDGSTAYVAGIRYEMDDRSPYAWRTNDYGTSWTKIVDGIAPGDFVRVLREDPNRKGLLYAGTEHGVYVSFDDGAHWADLSYDMPDTPITGLTVQQRDLVISTHGRSFWVLDDIETLRQIDTGLETADTHLFNPADAIRRSVPAVIDYYVTGSDQQVRLDVFDAEGELVRTLFEGRRGEGTHRETWDLRHRGAVTFDGIVLEGGNPARGPWSPPGRYQARLTVGDDVHVASFGVHRDPRLTGVTDADLVGQFRLASRIRDAESQANGSVLLIRDLRGQIQASVARSEDQQLKASAERFVDAIGRVEAQLYQVRNQSPKDKIAFPIRLNDRLTGLRSRLERGDAAPTAAYRDVFEELAAELDGHMRVLHDLISEDLTRLNDEFTRAGLPQMVVRDFGR
ncbi:MAG: glycosyl hydrolase [Gemmatimonadales bacterium]|nr:glycosyl hydrolase [Gemmatimonadales bacterium]